MEVRAAEPEEPSVKVRLHSCEVFLANGEPCVGSFRDVGEDDEPFGLFGGEGRHVTFVVGLVGWCGVKMERLFAGKKDVW